MFQSSEFAKKKSFCSHFINILIKSCDFYLNHNFSRDTPSLITQQLPITQKSLCSLVIQNVGIAEHSYVSNKKYNDMYEGYKAVAEVIIKPKVQHLNSWHTNKQVAGFLHAICKLLLFSLSPLWSIPVRAASRYNSRSFSLSKNLFSQRPFPLDELSLSSFHEKESGERGQPRFSSSSMLFFVFIYLL